MKIQRHIRRIAPGHGLVLAMILTSLLAVPVRGQSAPAAAAPVGDQQTFTSPEDAVVALTAAVASSDKAALRKMFGPATDELASGDDIADKASYARFAKRLAKMTNLVKRGDSTVILFLGAENWPFPFPIARSGSRWFFDGPAGIREMINRRIGANELTTIKVCSEYVRAQREYAGEDRDGDSVLEYAQRIPSTPGTMDGLYWANDDGPESPFGPVAAFAATEGYNIKSAPEPFHGYYFRVLTRQGRNAPGGAYGYVINGNMIAGFAFVAYPARWGSSGLTTFIVNQQGRIYQKDLGQNTAAIAAGMRAYDPDSTWSPVDDK